MKNVALIPTRSILILLGLVVASTSGYAQDAEPLPDNFDALIQLKQQTLKQYSELQKTGPPEEAIQVLRKIVDIHRKALKVAITDKKGDDLIAQLGKVFAEDAEYLSDQLFAQSEYKESVGLRREIEEFYQKLFGPRHEATQRLHWKAVATQKLSIAPKEQQVAYAVAASAEGQAQQAMQNGQLDVAAKIYKQLIDAEVAVFGESHPDVAVDLNEFGRVCWGQKKYEEAEALYKRSLKARESTTGKDLQFATTSANLGVLYHATERFDEAEKQYLAAASIREQFLGSTNEAFTRILQQLRSLYQQSGDAEKLAAIQQRIAAADPLVTVISHLPKGTFAAAAVQPSQLLTDPGMQLLPFEIIEAAGNQELGFNPLDVDAAVAFATLPTDSPPPNVGVLFKLKDGTRVEYPWVANMQPVQGQPYLKEPSGMCYVELDDGVVLVGTEEAVRQSLTNAGETQVGAMLKADRGRGQLIAAANLQMVRPTIKEALAEAPPVPPVLEGLKSIPLDTNTASLWLDVSGGLKLTLVLNSADEPTAKKISEAISRGLNFGMQMAMQGIESELTGDEPIQAATRAYIQRVAKQYLNNLQPSVSGSSVVVQAGSVDATVPVAVALLLPAVQAARDAARRVGDTNSLKQIGLAMHNYHDVHGKFPTRASYDKDGKPLLSWRVHLLPYLEQQGLYEQFKLDEPWDSEHNMKLAEQMPEIFQNRNATDPSKTQFVTLDGKGTSMEGNNGLTLADFTDGLSNTIMVVEANPKNGAIWTKPQDLRFDEQNPTNGLGTDPNGFQVLFADGSARLISADIDHETLKNLIIRNDGKAIDPSRF